MHEWHFLVEFIPTSVLPPAVDERGIYPEGSYWDKTVPKQDVERLLTRQLGRPKKTTHGVLDVWGAEEGDHILAAFLENFEPRRLIFLTGLIDARSPSESFMKLLCELAIALECYFFAFDQDSRIDPVFADLSHALTRSRAAFRYRNGRAKGEP